MKLATSYLLQPSLGQLYFLLLRSVQAIVHVLLKYPLANGRHCTYKAKKSSHPPLHSLNRHCTKDLLRASY